MTLAQIAKELFTATLEAVSVPKRMCAHVRCESGLLHVEANVYAMQSYRHVCVIAIGKAAVSMAHTFIGIADSCSSITPQLDAIVVSGDLPESRDGRLRYLRGGHPLPSEESQDAADVILEALSGLCADD